MTEWRDALSVDIPCDLINNLQWSQCLWLFFSPFWPSSLMPNSAPRPFRSPVLMTFAPPTPFAKKLLKPEDPIPLPISLASNTSTRWNPNAGLASAWLLMPNTSTSRDADRIQSSNIYFSWGRNGKTRI